MWLGGGVRKFGWLVFSLGMTFWAICKKISVKGRSPYLIWLDPPLSLRLDYMKSQSLYRERKIGIFPSSRADIKEGIGIVPCLIAYMGGKRGIFPSPSAYIEGNRLEFFQVPEPV